MSLQTTTFADTTRDSTHHQRVAEATRQPRVILLIDGDPRACIHVEDNAEVMIAHVRNAGEALRTLFTAPPSAYLLNVALDDMSGLDLYGILRERWPEVPGYLFSEARSDEIEIRARCAGSSVFFFKPFPEQIVRLLLQHPSIS